MRRALPLLVPLLCVLLAGCDRLLPFAALPGDGRQPRPVDLRRDSPPMPLYTVCASGCEFVDIAAALSALPGNVTIEVRDDRYYPGNLVIKNALTVLRAGIGAHPAIVGHSGRDQNALSISASGVTIAGFQFRGASQRAIMVTESGVTIHHCSFTADFNAWDCDQYFRGTGVLLSANGTNNASLYNNTFYGCEEALQILDAPTAGNVIKLRNNIFVAFGNDKTCAGRALEPILWIKSTLTPSSSLAWYKINSDYDLFFFTGPGACMAYDYKTGEILTLSDWQSRAMDLNSKFADPLLSNPIAPAYDYHEKVGGPAVDAGDPAFAVGPEPMPNGNRINAGCFGGTAEAAKSSM